MNLSPVERTFLREFITQIQDASDSAIHGFDDLKDGPLKDFINDAGASLVAIAMHAQTLLRQDMLRRETETQPTTI